jgi:hypothetical protein
LRLIQDKKRILDCPFGVFTCIFFRRDKVHIPIEREFAFFPQPPGDVRKLPEVAFYPFRKDELSTSAAAASTASKSLTLARRPRERPVATTSRSTSVRPHGASCHGSKHREADEPVPVMGQADLAHRIQDIVESFVEHDVYLPVVF